MSKRGQMRRNLEFPEYFFMTSLPHHIQHKKKQTPTSRETKSMASTSKEYGSIINSHSIDNTKEVKHSVKQSASDQRNNFSKSIGDLEQIILNYLVSHSAIDDTISFAQENNVDHQLLVGEIKSLLVDGYILDEPLSKSFWALTDEGADIASNGSPEFQIFSAVSPTDGMSVGDLNAKFGNVAKIGLGACMKSKWLRKEGEAYYRAVDNAEDETAILLSALRDGRPVSEEDLKNLKRRKLVQQVTKKSFRVTRGPEFQPVRVKKMADLTKSMLGNKNEVSLPEFFVAFIIFFGLDA
jgi:hypothetical protein